MAKNIKKKKRNNIKEIYRKERKKRRKVRKIYKGFPHQKKYLWELLVK